MGHKLIQQLHAAGLCNAAQNRQRVIDNVIEDHLPYQTFVYLNDLFLFSQRPP